MTGRIIARHDPFADFETAAGWPFRDLLRGRASVWADEGRPALVPAMDVTEDGEQYVVAIEVPGVAKDDVTVEVHENVLTIRGEKKDELEEKNEQRRYVERRYGTFSRSFTLPGDADAEHVHAEYDKGVLTISIRKSPEPKPRTVSIKG